MKRKLTVFAVIMMLLCILAVQTVFAGGEPEGDMDYTIAYIRPGNVEYYKYAADGVVLAGEVKGIKVIDYQSDYKMEKELANIEDAITQQVDGIILFSVSASAIDAAVVKANEAGIPIFMVYGYSEDNKDKFVGSIQSDGIRSGGLMGEWVADNISSGEIACIAGMLGRGDAEAYRDGFFNEALKNSSLSNVGTYPGDWDTQKAFTVMQDLVTAYPNLQAVFVQNEGMSMGAIRALEEAGKQNQVALVSQNGSPDGINAIMEGKLTSTVGWSCSQESIIALHMLVDHLNGKDVPKLTLTPMNVITEDNLDEVVPWVPTEELVEMSWKIDYWKDLEHSFAN